MVAFSALPAADNVISSAIDDSRLGWNITKDTERSRIAPFNSIPFHATLYSNFLINN
jgi:hypothetical protein